MSGRPCRRGTSRYGIGDILDDVNELSGPPFARIDLGCDAVGTVSYPETEVQFYSCTNRPTAVTAQGKLYFDLISAAAGGDPARASYHCYTQADGCQGEALGTGNRDAQAALIAGCVPRHQ